MYYLVNRVNKEINPVTKCNGVYLERPKRGILNIVTYFKYALIIKHNSLLTVNHYILSKSMRIL